MKEKKRHMDVDAIALLGRIALDDHERAQFGIQLENILGYIDQLQSVDIDGVEAAAHAFEVINVWRSDAIESSFSQEEAISNAPAEESGQMRVPKIVDDAS